MTSRLGLSRLGLLSLALGVMISSGCAMCCAPYDCNYPYIGGRWVRDNPCDGRVGSAFAPAGHRVEEATVAHGSQTPTEAMPLTPRRDGANYLPMQ
jgi:hypothetical protein